MPTLIGVIIVVSGLVFGTGLLGTLSYNAIERWTRKVNLTDYCNCKTDIDSSVESFPWHGEWKFQFETSKQFTITRVLIRYTFNCFINNHLVSLGKLEIDPSSNSKLTWEKRILENHLCSGALINSKFGLFSSHCLRFMYDQRIGIGAGGDLLAIHEKGRIPISRIFFNSTNSIDDIAIVELAREIDFENELMIRPACFRASVPEKTEEFGQLIASGFNLIEKTPFNKDYFGITRFLTQSRFKDLSLQDNNCDKRRKICARSKINAKCDCWPDSSAPLHAISENVVSVVGMHQVSLFPVNTTTLTGCPEIQFTRLSAKMPFIRSVAKEMCLV